MRRSRVDDAIARTEARELRASIPLRDITRLLLDAGVMRHPFVRVSMAAQENRRRLLHACIALRARCHRGVGRSRRTAMSNRSAIVHGAE
jgi:hypothetical protein